MAYRIRRDEPLGSAFQRILAGELQEALDCLRRPGDPHARVHGARKAIKRTRAALRLIHAALGREFVAMNRRLRDAARRLSCRRDAAVALATFDALVPGPDPDLARVRDALAAARDASAALADDDALARAAADLDPLLARVAAGSPLVLDWSALRPGLKNSYARGRRAMRHALAAGTPEAFHAWRRRAKDLWYHTLLLQGLWRPVQLAVAGALEELSDHLGDDHDLTVLRHALAALPELAPDLRAQLGRLADARSTELRDAARVLGRRIYAERPRHHLARLRRYWRTWRRPPVPGNTPDGAATPPPRDGGDP